MAPEVEEWLASFSTLTALVWIGFIILVGIGVYKAWPVLSRFVATINALGGLPKFMADTQATLGDQNDTLQKQNGLLAVIKHEVLPNSGGSLRDAVDRQGVTQSEQGADLTSIKEKLVKDHVRLEILEHTIPNTKEK